MRESGSIVASGVDAARTRSPAIIERFARRAVLARLAGIKHGRIVIEDGDERITFGQDTSDADLLRTTIRVLDQRFYSDLALGGSMGAGEAYMAGSWTTDDLIALVQIMIRNRDVMEGMDGGLARLANPARRLLHYFNRNTRAGSQRNIAAHYDLGNDFFELILDPTLMYSCAIFTRPDATLEEAAVAKVDRICRKLDLRAHDHLLEIGTGWGGFAIHAAKNYGCRVTTTTISRAQHDYAVKKIAEQGLGNRITVLFKDYRDLSGQFDKAVSIEMIEAVGHHFVDSYFHKCGELLKPDGVMLLQAITIADQYYESAVRNVDFIKKYIFPGSFIPSVTSLCNSITSASDLRLFHLEDITPNYAETLKNWRLRMFHNIERVRALGYPEEFIRMWDFYLSYCEGGFRERYIGDVQMLLTKPDSRIAPILPSLS